MRRIIKKLPAAFLSAAMVTGLFSCSNTPSTWGEVDNSPWKAKRAAESTNVVAEDFVELTAEEMEQMALSEVVEQPIAMPEPVVLAEPAPVVMVEPEPVVVTGLYAASESGFVVQAFAGVSEASINRYKNAHDLYEMITVRTVRDGKVMYVLVSLHDYKSEALQAADAVMQKTGSKPWVRTVAGLRKYAVD